MRVMVTGGCGFIGSHLVDRLIKEEHHVIVIDNLSTGSLKNLNPQAKFVEMDIRDPNIAQIFETYTPEIVFHLAAQVDVQKSINIPEFDASINIIGTINILNHCAKYNVNKIIYSSSAAIYGNPEELPINEDFISNPISFYGISKYTPENYIKVFCNISKLKYTILRFSNVYGERQSSKGEGGVISIFFNKYLNDAIPVIYGDGNQTRDFIYVKDVVSANVLVMHEGEYDTFNISTNTPVNINEIARKISDITNSTVETVYMPERPGDIKDSYMDNTKIFNKLGWVPSYTIEQGLAETYKNIDIIKADQ
ncbi:MAG: GDP-mannose 4,6-dehydratase [Paenibacillus sp.]|nr:GDP-mannose 4,6-dehydratase [Paenibacillus sp.]